VNDEPTITPPNRTHMAGLLLAGAGAVVAGATTVLLMGAGSPSVEAVALAIAAGTVLMGWPAAISTPMPVLRWGAILIAGSTLRLLTIVLLGLLLGAAVQVEAQAFWLGIAVGGMTLLAIETGVLMVAIKGAMRHAGIGLASRAHGGGHA